MITASLPARSLTIKPQPKLNSDSAGRFLLKNIGIVCVFAFWMFSNLLITFAMEMGGPDIPSGIPAYCTFGVVGSQIVFLGFLLAMYPIGFVARFFLTAALGAFLLLALWTGEMIFGSNDIQEMLSHLGALPGLILAFAAPFALAKYMLNRQLTFTDHHSEPGSKLTVSSLLIGTALVAGAVTMFQVEEKTDQAALGIALLISCGAGLMALIPYSLHIISSRYHWVSAIVASLIAWFLTVSVLKTLTSHASLGVGRWAQIGWSSTAFALFMSLGVALIALKASGVTTLDVDSVEVENTFRKQY